MSATTRLQLRVSPGSSSARIVGRHGVGWKVRVAAPPEAGKANRAVLELLAAALGVPERDVRLVSGQAARDKIVSVAGIAADETERRLVSVARGRGVG